MTSIGKHGGVGFRFFRRNAYSVRIVGDFAGAGDDGFEMTDCDDGWWHAKVALAAGEYRFPYVADGVWYPDYASNGIEATKLGLNSVLVVPDRMRCTAQAGKLVA